MQYNLYRNEQRHKVVKGGGGNSSRQITLDDLKFLIIPNLEEMRQNE